MTVRALAATILAASVGCVDISNSNHSGNPRHTCETFELANGWTPPAGSPSPALVFDHMEPRVCPVIVSPSNRTIEGSFEGRDYTKGFSYLRGFVKPGFYPGQPGTIASGAFDATEGCVDISGYSNCHLYQGYMSYECCYGSYAGNYPPPDTHEWTMMLSGSSEGPKGYLVTEYCVEITFGQCSGGGGQGFVAPPSGPTDPSLPAMARPRPRTRLPSG